MQSNFILLLIKIKTLKKKVSRGFKSNKFMLNADIDALNRINNVLKVY